MPAFNNEEKSIIEEAYLNHELNKLSEKEVNRQLHLLEAIRNDVRRGNRNLVGRSGLSIGEGGLPDKSVSDKDALDKAIENLRRVYEGRKYGSPSAAQRAEDRSDRDYSRYEADVKSRRDKLGENRRRHEQIAGVQNEQREELERAEKDVNDEWNKLGKNQRMKREILRMVQNAEKLGQLGPRIDRFEEELRSKVNKGSKGVKADKSGQGNTAQIEEKVIKEARNIIKDTREFIKDAMDIGKAYRESMTTRDKASRIFSDIFGSGFSKERSQQETFLKNVAEKIQDSGKSDFEQKLELLGALSTIKKQLEGEKQWKDGSKARITQKASKFEDQIDKQIAQLQENLRSMQVPEGRRYLMEGARTLGDKEQMGMIARRQFNELLRDHGDMEFGQVSKDFVQRIRQTAGQGYVDTGKGVKRYVDPDEGYKPGYTPPRK